MSSQSLIMFIQTPFFLVKSGLALTACGHSMSRPVGPVGRLGISIDLPDEIPAHDLCERQ